MKHVFIFLFFIGASSFVIPLHAKSTETYNVRYAVAEDGSVMHIAIWSDCVIGTVVAKAQNVGLQIITLLDGSRFTSTNCSQKKGYFVHKYAWGKVTSWDNKQIIEIK